MRRTVLSRCVLLCALLVCVGMIAGCGGGEVSSQDLATELESCYRRWSAAGVSGDLVTWRDESSQTSYQRTLNGLISMKERLSPQTLQNLASFQPDLAGYTWVGVNEGPQTAVMVYFGAGKDKPDHFLLLDFVQENDVWKFHWLETHNELDDAEARWVKRDLTFLDEAPFAPIPGIPPPQPDVPRPDEIAYFRIESLGYATVARVHGIDYGPIVDNTVETLIFGGLQRGDNQIELTVDPVASGGVKSFRAAILVVVDQDGPPTIEERFVYEPPANEIPPSHTWTLTVP
jgi:hypothetical protein